MKFMLSAAVATAALLAAGAASAQTGVYGSLGYSHYTAEIEDTDSDVTLGAITGRITARPQPWLAVEGEASIGVFDDEESEGGFTATVGLNHDVGVYLVGLFPVSPQADLFARLGAGLADLEAELRGPGVNERLSEDEQYLGYGVGAQFFWDGANGVRVDWTRIDFREADGELDRFGIAYVRRFR